MNRQPTTPKKEPILRFPDSVSTQIRDGLEQGDWSYTGREAIESVLELLNPQSKKHLESVKKVSSCLASATSCSPAHVQLVEALLNGLYYCEGGSLKSAFNGAIGKLHPCCLEAASSSMKILLEKSIGGGDLKAIEMVSSLLQSDFGRQVVHSCLQLIISHFTIILSSLMKELESNETSSLEVAKIHTKIQLTTRTLVTIVSSTQQGIEEDQLLEPVISILNFKGVPVDIQGNCAKVLVVLMTTNDPTGARMDHLIQRVTGSSTPSRPLASLVDSVSSRVNLCLALLTSLKPEAILKVYPPHGTLLGGIILKILLDSSGRLNDLALLVARLLDQWLTKCLDSLLMAEDGHPLVAEWNSASDQLLDLTLTGMEHQVDSIRHTAKDAFQLILKIQLHLNQDVERIVQAISNMPRLKKSKYLALACLAKTAQLAPLLLRMADNLPGELLQVAAEDPALSNQAKEVFNLLMFHSMRSSGESWTELWLHPLLDALGSHPEGQGFEGSLVQLLEQFPEVMDRVEHWCQEDPSRMGVYMTALLACRKQGLPLIASLEAGLMEQAMRHVDDKVRLTAFGVIIESPKSTQLFTQLELDWVQQFIVENVGSTNPAFRQQFCSYVKKFLAKMRDGGLPLVGRADQTASDTLDTYRRFLAWMTDKCLTDLGPGSSFSRRFLSLHFLKLIRDSVGFPDPANRLNTFPALSRTSALSLVDCLFDSYDVNKDLALDLIKSPAMLAILYQDPEKAELVELYWNSALELSQSLRSADTVAATYLFRWLIHHMEGGASRIGDPSIGRKETAYYVVEELVKRLKSQLEAAAGNLRRMAMDSPVYGSLSSIRFLLMDQQDHLQGYDPAWSSLILEIVDLSFRASAIASPVVTSDSPEGFLPPEDPDGSADCAAVDAQALLVCAWRTVKEVALLFGHATSWVLGTDNRMVDNAVVLKMGLHLRQLLMETKHRGAFEQVYCGFSQVCNALSRCAVDEELRRLPSEWLKDLIADLEDDQSAAKLCATRRSAGLPFMFQAILSVEVELGRKELFELSVESLLGLASKGSIHALNILRTLYRESRLNRVIGPYVARGLMLAIGGFEANDWPERNSSTLLFSALMTRIFGVPRSKTDSQKRNSLTGRLFFQLYPELYPFLLDRIRAALDDAESIHLHPSLFPALVLMGRLTPSACESPDATFRLEPFVPLIRRCGSSPVLKTRQLAAQALTPLLTQDSFVPLLQDLLKSVPAVRSHNELHGTLLQILQFVKDLPHCSRVQNEAFRLLEEQIPRLVFLLENASYLIRYEFGSILLALTVERLGPTCREELLQICRRDLLSASASSGEPFYPLYCRSLVKLFFTIQAPVSSDVAQLMRHRLVEVKLEAVEQLDRLDPVTYADVKPALEGLLDVEESPKVQSCALSVFDRYAESSAGLLERMLRLYPIARQDAVRCAALAAAGRLVVGSHGNSPLMVDWTVCLADATQSDVTFRLEAARSLQANWRLLQVPNHCPGDLVTNLWHCLLCSLTDDDESVRQAGSAVVAQVVDSDPKRMVHPAVALERALGYFCDHVGPSYPGHAMTILCKLALSSGSEEQSAPESDSQSFEKDDSDAFYEPLHHAELYCHSIQRWLPKYPPLSESDGQVLVKILQGCWQTGPKEFDISVADSITSRRRIVRSFTIDLARLFCLSRSLQSAHPDIATLHRDVSQLFKKLPKSWITHSINQLVSHHAPGGICGPLSS